MKKRNIYPLVALFCFWLLITLACNFPRKDDQSQNIMAWELRQTLDALSTATTQGTQVVTPQEVATLAPTLFTGTALSTDVPNIGSPTGAWNDSLDDDDVSFRYYTQPGDTLAALVGRFEVEPWQINSDQPLPETGFIPPGRSLNIPNLLGERQPPYTQTVLPDSELIYSPSAAGFDVAAFVYEAGGYLSDYTELVQSERLSGADILQRVALESSVNIAGLVR